MAKSPKGAVCDGCRQLLYRQHIRPGPMLQDAVWLQIAEDHETLCQYCIINRVHERLGRRLALADLLPVGFNLFGQPHSYFDLFAAMETEPPSNLAEWDNVEYGDIIKRRSASSKFGL